MLSSCAIVSNLSAIFRRDHPPPNNPSFFFFLFLSIFRVDHYAGSLFLLLISAIRKQLHEHIVSPPTYLALAFFVFLPLPYLPNNEVSLYVFKRRISTCFPLRAEALRCLCFFLPPSSSSFALLVFTKHELRSASLFDRDCNSSPPLFPFMLLQESGLSRNSILLPNGYLASSSLLFVDRAN